MDKKIYEFIILAFSIIAMIASYIVGLSSGMEHMPIFIFIAIALGGCGYYFVREDSTGKRNFEVFPAITVSLIVFFFIIMAFGSCIGSCTKSSGDKNMERYEITGHYY